MDVPSPSRESPARSLARWYLVRHQGSSNSSGWFAQGPSPREHSASAALYLYAWVRMLTARRGRSHPPTSFAFSRNLSGFSLPRFVLVTSFSHLRPQEKIRYPCWARDGAKPHCEHTCATRSYLRPARVGDWRGRGGGRRGRVGDRPTNRPLGYAGYGQSASARSQVYPGTPTLTVAPSRIDFNPSLRTPSGVNKGW